MDASTILKYWLSYSEYVPNATRLSDGYIGVCFGGGERDFLMHHYTRDKQIEDAQMQSVADYWNKYIVTSTIPEFSGNSSLDLTAEYKYCEHNINTNTVDTLSADLLPSFQEYAELSAKCAALNKEIRQYKEEENRLMSEIKPNMPDGVTVVKSGNEMPFIIKVKDSKRETVNSNTLIAKSMSATDFLGSLAQKLNGKSLGFSIPKIKIQKLKGTKK